MSPVAAVTRHGIRTWWKDRRSILLGLLTPILLYLVFVSIYSGRNRTMPHLDVAWIDQDKSETSMRFANLLKSDGAVNEIDSDHAPLAVIIRPGFGDQVTQFKRMNDSLVRIDYEPSSAMQANMLKGLMTKAGFLLVSESWGNSKNPTNLETNVDPHWRRFATLMGQAFHESREFMQKRGDNPMQESFIPIALHPIAAAHQNFTAAQQLAGVAVIFLLFSVARAGAILLDEKGSGTLKRILSSPLSIKELVFGKLFSIALNGCAQISLMCLVGWLFFQVPIFHSPLALLLIILATALCAASFGLFFASFCQTPEQVQGLATFVIIAMSIVGGSMIPKFLLPAWAQKLSALTLSGWAMDGFMNVLVRGLGFSGIALPVIMLLLLTGAFLGTSFMLLPKRLYE